MSHMKVNGVIGDTLDTFWDSFPKYDPGFDINVLEIITK